MSEREHREMDQLLVGLALGEVAEPERGELLSHLSSCGHCRTTYAEIVEAVDATITAAPKAQPPAGFDLRVLSALGIQDDRPRGPVARMGRLVRPRTLLAAAALLIAVAAGAWGGATLLDDGPDASLAGDTTVLWTDDGDQVGTASVAWMHSDRVLVVSVNQAPVGVEYTCRVQLAEGVTRDLGRWSASSPGGGTWVVPAPDGDLNSIQLVTDSGAVWSQGRLP